MKIIGYIVQKEFKQIFRNKGMLPIIFILPILQLLVLSNAATYEVKSIQFAYIDQDRSSFSRELIEKFNASEYFKVKASYPSYEMASEAILKGEVDVLLMIPQHFERDLTRYREVDLSVTID